MTSLALSCRETRIMWDPTTSVNLTTSSACFPRFCIPSTDTSSYGHYLWHYMNFLQNKNPISPQYQNLSVHPNHSGCHLLHRTKKEHSRNPLPVMLLLSHKAASALSVSAGASSVALSRIASLYSYSFSRSGEDAAHFPGAATHTAKTVSNRPPRIYHYTPSNCRWMSTHVTRDSFEGVFAKDLLSDEFHCMFASIQLHITVTI